MLSYANEGVKIKKEHMKNILSKLEEEQGYSLSNGTYFDSEEFNYDNAYDVSIIWEERLDKKGKYRILDDDDFYYIFCRYKFQIRDFYSEEKNLVVDTLMDYVEGDIPLYEETLKMIENLD
nr:MAG TPA: hypothetical protein [Caudoviricetes sp.]